MTLEAGYAYGEECHYCLAVEKSASALKDEGMRVGAVRVNGLRGASGYSQ